MGERRLLIHTSNSLPVLVDRLAGLMAESPLPPMRRETIVVSSQGMARWLTLELARRHSVSASLELPFPAALCRQLTGGGTAPDPFDREVLTWRLFRLLGALPGARPLRPLRRYLADDPDQRKRLQLAQRVAGRFDDYQLYRPDLLQTWERGGEDSTTRHAPWQAWLWRTLLAEIAEPSGSGAAGAQPSSSAGGLPFDGWMDWRSGRSEVRPVAHRFLELRQLLAERAPLPPGVPARLHVFGISTLPPMFVELLAELSRSCPVWLYLVSPTEHYWGDLPAARAIDGQEGDRGHPLLGSLGKLGRDFFNVLLDADRHGEAWSPLQFESPGRDSALHALQSDVLELVDRGGGDDPEKLALRPDDDSLQIHDCHSRMREMQVLRDRILAAFDADPTLQPDDAMVLVPDIAVYAPYIQAVFGQPMDDGTAAASARRPQAIPFHIADRGLAAEQPPVAAFLRILEAAGGRLRHVDVLDLLEQPCVRARFGIHRGDLPVLRQWVQVTRIRWAEDGAHKRRLQLPADDGNTWRQGLRRLLLGYGTGPTDELVAGLLPHGETTTSRAELLGRFLDYADTLFLHCRTLARPCGLESWSDRLSTLLDDMFCATDDGEEDALQAVREQVGRLSTLSDLAAVGEPVQPAVIAEHLSEAFSDHGQGVPFLTGRMTFAALKPMRTIPVQLLAIAGLNDEDFPRRDRPLPFDMIAESPRRGDRSLRADDRQLFLETLLAARSKLMLCYVGHSQKDNSVRAPSVVLSELMECLEQTFRSEDGRPVPDVFVVEHPLQAFSRRYFDGSDPQLFSYAAENCTRSHGGGDIDGTGARTAFADGEIPVEIDSAASLGDLLTFWVNPSKFFCTRTLELRLHTEDDREEDVEPFMLHGLDRYAMEQGIAERLVDGEPPLPDEFELLRQRGILPAAAVGRAAYDLSLADTELFVQRIPKHEPVRADLEVRGDGFAVTGVVGGLTPDRRIVWRAATIKPKDLLRAWIHHVFVNTARVQGFDLPGSTLLVGRKGRRRFRPLPDPLPLLADLIEGFRLGHRRPLPFFVDSSHAWTVQTLKLESGSRASKRPEQAASEAWAGTDRRWGNGLSFHIMGDGEDPYTALCQRGRDPIGVDRDDFIAWTERIWRPVLEWSDES